MISYHSPLTGTRLQDLIRKDAQGDRYVSKPDARPDRCQPDLHSVRDRGNDAVKPNQPVRRTPGK